MKGIIAYLVVFIIAFSTSAVFAGDDGIKKIFYSSGKLMSVISSKDRMLHGVTKLYYESGKMEAILSFKNGMLHGEIKEYNESGKLIHSSSRKDGILHGTERFYNESGQIVQESSYKDGKKLQGFSREYYKSGGLKNEFIFIGEMPSGYAQIFYESGGLKNEITYENNKLTSGYLYSKDGEKRKMTEADLIKFKESLK